MYILRVFPGNNILQIYESMLQIATLSIAKGSPLKFVFYSPT
jgi:hypothetical protein